MPKILPKLAFLFAENTEFAADASKKTFYFDEQEVQFVKFVAKTSNDGWVAVSEFDVDNEKVKEMTDSESTGKSYIEDPVIAFFDL